MKDLMSRKTKRNTEKQRLIIVTVKGLLVVRSRKRIHIYGSFMALKLFRLPRSQAVHAIYIYTPETIKLLSCPAISKITRVRFIGRLLVDSPAAAQPRWFYETKSKN
jgi:hypothetical protein